MCTQNVPTTHGNLVHTCVPLPVFPTMQMAAIVLLEGGEDGERKSVNNRGGGDRAGAVENNLDIHYYTVSACVVPTC